MTPTSSIRLFISGIVPGRNVIIGLHRDGTFSFRRDDEANPVREGFRDYRSTINAAREHYAPAAQTETKN